MIKDTCPPIYQRLKKEFNVSWNDGIIITYFPDIYWKGGDALSKEKIAHEKTHLRQQEDMGVKLWWDKYITDKEFRLSQEIEAYKNEVSYIRQTVKDREKCFKMIHQIALDLSSSIYGNICSYAEAMKLLK
jgi:hypothetical protein